MHAAVVLTCLPAPGVPDHHVGSGRDNQVIVRLCPGGPRTHEPRGPVANPAAARRGVVMTITPSQPGRPVGAVGEETRSRIIAAVMRCVAEVGYAQTTIREIARAAGITSGSLYHYFPTKSELLKATLAAIDDIAMPRLRAAADRGDSVVDRLDAVLDESDRLMREYPDLAAFERAMRFENAAYLRAGDPDRIGFQALRDVLGAVIGEAQRQGSLSAETDVRGATDVIYALARGLTAQAANLPPDAYHATLRSARQLIRGTLHALS